MPITNVDERGVVRQFPHPAHVSAGLDCQEGPVVTDQAIFLPATFKFGNPVHPKPERFVLTRTAGSHTSRSSCRSSASSIGRNVTTSPTPDSVARRRSGPLASAVVRQEAQ